MAKKTTITSHSGFSIQIRPLLGIHILTPIAYSSTPPPPTWMAMIDHIYRATILYGWCPSVPHRSLTILFHNPSVTHSSRTTSPQILLNVGMHTLPSHIRLSYMIWWWHLSSFLMNIIEIIRVICGWASHRAPYPLEVEIARARKRWVPISRDIHPK